MHKMGTHSPAALFWKFTKWLKRPFDDVSSTRMLRSIRSSKCEINGPTHPMLQAGVFPVPDGARPNINRFPFSWKESNSFTALLPINAQVHGDILAKSSSGEVPCVFKYTFSHSWMWAGAISSCECEFRQAFSQDRLLNLPLQVLQQQSLCAKWRTLSGKTLNKIHVGISPFDWFVWGFCHVKLTQYLRGSFEKKSYACCFEVNYHKLYINRKVMNCRFRKKYPLCMQSLL